MVYRFFEFKLTVFQFRTVNVIGWLSLNLYSIMETLCGDHFHYLNSFLFQMIHKKDYRKIIKTISFIFFYYLLISKYIGHNFAASKRIHFFF